MTSLPESENELDNGSINQNKAHRREDVIERYELSFQHAESGMLVEHQDGVVLLATCNEGLEFRKDISMGEKKNEDESLKR